MSARGAGPCARTGREGATVAEPDNLDGTRRSGARPDAPRRAAAGTDQAFESELRGESGRFIDIVIDHRVTVICIIL